MRQVLLIGQREISHRLRSKLFVGSIIVFALVILGVGSAVRLASSYGVFDSDTKMVLTPHTQPYRQVLNLASKKSNLFSYEFINADSAQQASAKVKSGDADLALIEKNGHLALVSKSKVGLTTKFIIEQVASRQSLLEYINQLGGNEQGLAQHLKAHRVEVEQLGDTDKDSSPSPQRLFGPVVIMFILFIAILTASQMIASGVVTEKSSRVVELLVSTTRPVKLLVGKVTALCLLTLIGEVIIMAAVIGAIKISGITGLFSFNVFAVSLWGIAFAVVGFLIYGFCYAALASLASRQEDLAVAIMPLTVIAMLALYIPYFSVLKDPSSTLSLTLGFIPLFSCFVAPVLVALGTMSGIQAAISLVLSIVFLVLAIFAAARIYRNSILRFGARQSLFKVLRGSRGAERVGLTRS